MSKNFTPKRRTYKDLKEEEKQKLLLFHVMKRDLLFVPIVVILGGLLLMGLGFGLLFVGTSNMVEPNLNLTDITVGELTNYIGVETLSFGCILIGYIFIIVSILLNYRLVDRLKKDFNINTKTDRFKI